MKSDATRTVHPLVGGLELWWSSGGAIASLVGCAMSDTFGREFERYADIHRLNAFFGIEIDMEAEISGAIMAIARSIDLVHKAAQLAGKTKSVEMIEAIAELRVELSQAKIAAANANEHIAELTEQKQKLKAALAAAKAATEEEIVLGEDRLYYTTNGRGPFCTACYDKDKKLMLLAKHPTQLFGKYQCPVCFASYK